MGDLGEVVGVDESLVGAELVAFASAGVGDGEGVLVGDVL